MHSIANALKILLGTIKTLYMSFGKKPSSAEMKSKSLISL